MEREVAKKKVKGGEEKWSVMCARTFPFTPAQESCPRLSSKL